MDFKLDSVQVWAADVPDQAGGAAKVLAPLAEAGANLEYIWTSRSGERRGMGVIFVAPITGPDQTRAAQEVGLHRADDHVLLRIEGENRPGVAHSLAAHLAAAGLNLHSMSLASIGERFVAYVSCDSAEDTAKAVQVMAEFE